MPDTEKVRLDQKYKMFLYKKLVSRKKKKVFLYGIKKAELSSHFKGETPIRSDVLDVKTCARTKVNSPASGCLFQWVRTTRPRGRHCPRPLLELHKKDGGGGRVRDREKEKERERGRKGEREGERGRRREKLIYNEEEKLCLGLILFLDLNQEIRFSSFV